MAVILVLALEFEVEVAEGEVLAVDDSITIVAVRVA